MAHYKRGRPRTHSSKSIHGSETSWRAKNGLTPVRLTREMWRTELADVPWSSLWHPYKSRMNNWPRWWDIVFHTRPKRREAKALEQKVMQGYDPDELLWPVSNHKPHKYFW